MTSLIEELPVYGAILLLAVVQGLTEFLPVSSSGHLALGQMMLGVGEGNMVGVVVLHAGTLVAVVVYYRTVIAKLVRGLFDSSAEDVDGISPRQYAGLVILGNLPVILIGFTLKDQIEELFVSPWAVFAAMGATAALLWSTRGRTAGLAGPNSRRALLIGCAQAVAILPGASRSGWTIAVALWLGLKPEAAVRFSFLLSIPVIFGALVFELAGQDGASISVGPLLVGFVVAALVGLFALRWLVVLVRRMELFRFAIYLCILTLAGVGFLLMH